MSDNAPVAVFDSGIGGLTVVSALRRVLPHESIVYLGDTARVPYGGKSRETIERYSEEIAQLLVGEGAKVVVVACNSASALALPRLRAARPDIRVTSLSCPLLVPLIEEGLLDDPVTDAVLERYLGPLGQTDVDTLVLGCTHYPLLAAAIARTVGPKINLVDSAANCAAAVGRLLSEKGLAALGTGSGSLDLSFTDTPDRFLEVAGRALGLDTADVAVRSVPPLGQ
jgi:glutamate racemase